MRRTGDEPLRRSGPTSTGASASFANHWRWPMADLATLIRHYYDTAAPPVEADEVFALSTGTA